MGGGKKKNRPADSTQKNVPNGMKSEQNQEIGDAKRKQNLQNDIPKVFFFFLLFFFLSW